MKIFGKFLVTYFIMLSFFIITLVLTCSIPSSFLKNNIGKSLKTLKNEGIYPNFGFPFRQIILDNFTDSLMLNTAYSVDSNHPLKSALLNYRYEGKDDAMNQISNLEKLYLNKEIKKVGYERYWHGYLIYLRPLLIFFSYSQIRIILTLMLYFLFITFFYLSWEKLGKWTILSFTLGLIAVDFFYLGWSLQFSNVFLIGLLGAIYLFLTYKPRQNLTILFFIMGGLTSFFDLLTAPLITLGIPLITAIRLEKKNKLAVVYYLLSWLIGYSILWVSKWIIVQLLFAPSAVITAINRVAYRSFYKPNANFSYLKVIKLNLFQLIGYNPINKIIILSSLIFFLFFFLIYFKFRKEKLKNITIWILIATIPYLWYLIAANHSYIHVWYTYRNQLMSVVSLFLAAGEFINWPKIGAPKRDKN